MPGDNVVPFNKDRGDALPTPEEILRADINRFLELAEVAERAEQNPLQFKQLGNADRSVKWRQRAAAAEAQLAELQKKKAG